MDQLFAALLTTANEILTAGIVIIAASLLLYNLTRNLYDRVARTSGVVLGALTFVYICDTLISLSPGVQTYTNLLRAQWLGIGFMPVALYHLSDALLATTGLPSRGRRRRVIRLLYGIALIFFLLAAYTDIIIRPVIIASPVLMGARQTVTLDDGGGFPLYLAYFTIVTGAAFLNVQRARDRCIARSTRRRMGYLLIAMITPAIGVFPFALLLETGAEISLVGLALVNIANIFVILMLIFLAYPLSFFGSRIPDRLVKTELLRFLLRGPGTGLLALGAIVLTTSGLRVLGIAGVEFMPFAVVTVVLVWQWGVALSLPYIERFLIYPGEDADRIAQLQNLGDRLLTRNDLLQLLEAILASTCDYLRVSSAFVASLPRMGALGTITASQGPMIPDAAQIERFPIFAPDGEVLTAWKGFWLAPLVSRRGSGGEITGVFGIQARAGQIDLTEDDRRMFSLFLERAAQALDDLAVQAELFSVLEGLLPQVVTTRARIAALEYRPGHPVSGTDARHPAKPPLVQPDDHVDEALFKEQVRAALRHYWGGPGLTSSRLLDTELVRRTLNDHADTPANALRAVLLMGIEKLRPDGERKYHLPEWMLYNLVELRFIQQMMVRDVAQKLAMGESDLYRKQRIAIDQLGDILWQMERDLRRS